MSVSISISEQALAEQHNGPELAQLVAALDASSTDDCVDCGMKLGGLLGMFQWAIVHGYGQCSACKFPYVYYHYHELEPGRELLLQAWIPNADVPLAGG